MTEVWTRSWLPCCWDNDSSSCQRNEKTLTGNVLTSPSFSLEIKGHFAPVFLQWPHYTSCQAGWFCGGRYAVCWVPWAVRCRIAEELGPTFGGHLVQAPAQSKAEFTHCYACALADLNISSVSWFHGTFLFQMLFESISLLQIKDTRHKNMIFIFLKEKILGCKWKLTCRCLFFTLTYKFSQTIKFLVSSF